MNRMLFCLLIVLSVQGFGQGFNDSIILLNGKTFRGDFIELNEEYLVFNSPSKKGDFQLMIEKYRIFSYTNNDLETVLYEHQPDADNFLTVDESRKFTLGSYDARNAYNVKPVIFVSMGLTLGISLMDTYLTKNEAAASVTPGLKSGFFARHRDPVLSFYFTHGYGISHANQFWLTKYQGEKKEHPANGFKK